MTPLSVPQKATSRAASSRAIRRRPEDARLSVGFILAKRFTLCAFANFVDVLRLAADEGDRSRPILCTWTVLSDTMDAVPSSSGITVQPKERLGDPSRFDYIVVVGGHVCLCCAIDTITSFITTNLGFIINALRPSRGGM